MAGNLSLCTTWRHTKQLSYSSLYSYPPHQMEVRNQILASLAGKALTVPTRQEAGLATWAICPIQCIEKLLSLPGIESRCLCFLSPSLVTNPNRLSCFLCNFTCITFNLTKTISRLFKSPFFSVIGAIVAAYVICKLSDGQTWRTEFIWCNCYYSRPWISCLSKLKSVTWYGLNHHGNSITDR